MAIESDLRPGQFLGCVALKFCQNSYSCPSNFFKIARTIFGVIIFQDFAAPSLQTDAFDLYSSGDLKAL